MRGAEENESLQVACGWKRDFPIFKVKLYWKERDVLFEKGSTVNILGHETLVKYT